MDIVRIIPAFMVAVAIIALTPGPAFALIVRRTSVRGLRSGLATVVGLEAGLYVWALLVASGFAVVAASEVGYLLLKIVGCAVLLVFAARSLRAWWLERRDPGADVDAPVPPGSARRGLGWAAGEGFVVQMANPKAAIFLMALYPQFVPAGRPLFATTAMLGVLQVAEELVLYGLLALTVSRAGGWFRRSVVRRRMEALTGSVLVALGVRLALSER